MITLNAHSKHPMKKKNIVISGIWGQQILMIYDERSQTNSILHTMDVFLQYRDLYLLKYRQFYLSSRSTDIPGRQEIFFPAQNVKLYLMY